MPWRIRDLKRTRRRPWRCMSCGKQFTTTELTMKGLCPDCGGVVRLEPAT